MRSRLFFLMAAPYWACIRSRSFRLCLDLVEQLLDSHFCFESFVVFEDELGDSSQMMQSAAERAPDEFCGRSKTLQSFFPFFDFALCADYKKIMVEVRGAF